MDKKQFQETLPGFIGTDGYYCHPLVTNLYATDGAYFVFTNGGEGETGTAFWLFDLIASYQPKLRGEPFQVWTLKKCKYEAKDAYYWTVTCTDGDKGNGEVRLVEQMIEYSDFVLDEIALWCELGSIDGTHEALVVMLPSER